MNAVRNLREDVEKALEWDPSVDHSKITVSVHDGVVTLGGTVRTYAEKTAAGEAIGRLRGVRALANDIAVHLDSHDVPADTEIAEAVANALEWDTAVPLNAVKATVVDGWVTLTGKVAWQYQKSAAQVAAERTMGVKGVENFIALEPTVAPADVKAKIEQAFERHAGIDARRIQVSANGGTVTLTGSVRSLIDRDDAEAAAWAAPGVVAVLNRIIVSPY